MSLITTLSAFVSSNEPTQQSTVAAARPKLRANTDVRESYNVHISSAYHDKYKAKFQEFHDKQQCFGEDLARAAYQTRSEIKQAHQAETSTLGQMWIWARNMVVYGASNVDYESLSKNKNPEEIAYSAFKTGGADLGLKNNGFGDTLELWHAIKHTTMVYPEDITPTMVNEYQAQIKTYKTQVEAYQAQIKTLGAASPANVEDMPNAPGPFKLDIDAILAARGDDPMGTSPSMTMDPFGSEHKGIKAYRDTQNS